MLNIISHCRLKNSRFKDFDRSVITIPSPKNKDKVKSIPKLRSFLLLGSKDGVEFLEV